MIAVERSHNGPCDDMKDELAARRSIPAASIVIFLLLNVVAASVAFLIDRTLPPSFQGHYVLRVIIAISIFATLSVVSFRLFLAFFPLPSGPIIPNSRGELAYCVYMLFIIEILPLVHSSAFPFFLRSFAYLSLGSRIGPRSSCSGFILDPPLVTVGSDCQIGFEAVLTCHAFHRRRYELLPIVLGNDVTIGLRAVLLPGVTIGDGATIAAGAVVTSGTTIGADETWGGVPARLIKERIR